MQHQLIDRGLRPKVDLAADKPHGTRIRYMGGCKCLRCRAANSRYESARLAARKAGDWNGIVDAKRARVKIRSLSYKGVGYKRVAELTGIAPSIVAQIRSGKRPRIRSRTERLILAVKPAYAAKGAYIDAGPTWKRVSWLLDHGWSKAAIARGIGNDRALQLGPNRVTKRNADAVARLHEYAVERAKLGDLRAR